jgi:cytochrome c oxidase subunit 3
MSTTAVQDSHAHAHDDEHAHDPHLAHHFDTPEQQFSTSKLGIWLFLATEILMFGGLFCAYAVYRYNHPEVYLWAHKALDAKWGMINTIVLLASSFTMAWGVRAAQLNQKGLLQLMLVLTFMGGVVFMCIKAIEYKAKWEHHLFPGHYNALNEKFSDTVGENAAEFKKETILVVESHGQAAHGEGAKDHTAPEGAAEHPKAEGEGHEKAPEAPHGAAPAASLTHVGTLAPADGNAGNSDAASIAPPAFVNSGVNRAADIRPGHRVVTYADMEPSDRAQLNTFFSIYFMMTGLHGIHVLVGMGLMVWLFLKASAGQFSSSYFTPVDLTGLYWHLVDLIWIFLFPLLYLIH